ncbi:DUF368 domain-containing protein [Aliifodinibius halophilus]|uniref:DUF368 domain-containing protein n=2 Tax=Fodinibius halophilus TaxID=1736908 RepID=A0A6M1T5Y9_9BACT|nr:DUF368 domain-containing protein [Fodinibius halophilus]
MGSADIVPGVSGGTMALIVGIYTRLINAIKSFDTHFFKHLFTFKLKKAFEGVDWRFMGVLLAGMFAAVLFFTKVVPLQIYMFTDPELIFGLFFGLIVGSIVILTKAIENFGWIHGLMILIGAVIGFWVVTLVPADTPDSPLYVFLSGSVAICAMILPGISGSYILLILRKYDYILSQIGSLGTVDTTTALLALLPFVVGAICGLMLFSRLLSWLLKRYEAKTLAVLIGFLIGSLYVIWPYQNRTYKEIVSKKTVVEYMSPKAVELRNNPPSEKRPEFHRLGEVINPDATFNKLKKIELLTIKKKLIKSDPFVPYATVKGANTAHFWDGVIGVFIGLLMVLGLDYVRAKG